MNKVSSGWLNGFAGMLIFSASLPATRIAVIEFDPIFLSAFRAVAAGLIACAVLALVRVRLPERTDLGSLFITALGVVVGFPVLTALALQHITAAHSLVFIALLPLMTALFGVLRADERPPMAFWVLSVLGSLIVMGYALYSDADASLVGDLLMLAAVVLCGMGYAEGGKLSRRLGGWQVICWSLLLSLPAMLVLLFFTYPESLSGISTPAWLALAYVSIFSMLVGFIFWYRGLAQGGIATVGQLQLLQPFFGLLLAALLLKEHISLAMIITSLLVVSCVAGARQVSMQGTKK